ncbi:MAG TPA: class I SAM-dependent methyltransferase, partial [Chloroflexia bacterium]|nr:class I SAM-dependent methyltransferase [Chloroflexia bacterium]
MLKSSAHTSKTDSVGGARLGAGSGIDASARLVAVARDRNPGCDIRVGDMHALPWDPASFD